MNNTTSEKPTSKPRRKFAREPRGQPISATALPSETAKIPAGAAQNEPKPKSKASVLLDLLARPEGTTLEQMVSATDWLPHTTRAALTGLKKKGHTVTSTKADGVRTYRLITTEVGQGTSLTETYAKVDA